MNMSRRDSPQRRHSRVGDDTPRPSFPPKRESGDVALPDSPLPGEWTTKPFSEVADYQTGRTPARATTRYWSADASGTPWVSIGDMTPHGLISDTSERISPDAVRETFRGRISKVGTLLMSFKLTIGRVATIGVEACHNEAIISIYPKPGINQKYLEYFLAQVDYTDYQDRAVKGNTLNQEKIDRIAVVCPPEHEQEKIAAVLWKLQRAIATQDQVLKAIADLKQSAMQRLFTHGLRGEPIKDTEIGLIPDSWSVARLDACCDVLSSRLSYTELAASEGAEDEQAVNVHGVKVSDMNLPGNEFRFDTANLIRTMKLERAERKTIPADTVVFPKRGAAIATNKKRLTTTWTVLDPNLIGVRARKGMDNNYLSQWFEQFDLRTITEPGPTPQLNKKNLVPLLLPIPGTESEQRDIAAALATLDRKLAHHRRKRAALDALFQTLLHQLMTGAIRVADLDIDTSEVISPFTQGATA